MSLRIVLLGYGRMGKIIEQVALSRGHQVVLKVDEYDESVFESNEFTQADVVIEFTEPSAAARNCRKSIEKGLPVVSGTTGWAKEQELLHQWVAEDSERTFFWASNFSVGVNLFIEMNRRVANLMNGVKDYQLTMTEVHHIHKLDAPSGTAITIAENILDEYKDYNSWCLAEGEAVPARDELVISSERIDEVPGIHRVQYKSAVDEITLEHSAYGREGFALGAVLAAEYVQSHKGLLSMKDMLADL